MRLAFDYEPVDMGEEIIAVPVGDKAKDIAGVLKLNKTGLEVLQLLKEGKEADEIISLLNTKYENDEVEIKKVVENYINKLSELGLLIQ